MNICSICGKTIAWPRLIMTYYVNGVEMSTSTASLFGVGDMCQGHIMAYWSDSTVSLPNCKCTPSPVPFESERTPIPQAFLDAFKGEEADW